MVQFLGHGSPWLVLLLGLGGTAWAWRALTVQEQAFQSGRMEGLLDQTREAVDHRLEEQTQLLHASQGLVVGRPRLSATEWRAFISSLEPRQLSPGTRLMGYFPRRSLEGHPGAALLEPAGEGSPVGAQGERLLMLPSFWEAASRARDLGTLALTSRINLPGEQGALIAMMLPVYRDFSIPRTTEARRSEFQGLVVCLADGGELFKPLYGASPIPDLDVEIYDDLSCRPEHLVYDRDLCLASTGRSMAQNPGARRAAIEVGGKSWTVVVGFLPPVAVLRQGRPRVVAMGGMLLSLLAFGLTLQLATSRARLAALAHRLRESEARFRSVAETASCAIFIYGQQIEYMNEAGAKITGYDLEEIVGQPLLNLVHPLDRELVRARAEARLRGETVPPRYEFRILTRQGETRWIDFATGTLTLGARVLGLGTAFDVTDRVKASEGMLRVERRLHEAQKLESLGLLAGGVAHDFNNLLTIIQGNTSMIRDAMEEPEVAQACLVNIEDTCRHASELLLQMLTYSGRGSVQARMLDLNRLIQEISQLLSISLPRGAALAYELAETLPPVQADAAQLQQVVMNLVTNAAEAMGGRDGTVTLRSGLRDLGRAELVGLRAVDTMEPGPYVFLEVEDTGAGMTEATLARIFDPFFTTKATGKGLGLAAMRGIVRGHGGGVEIQSQQGMGTIFRVYLPIHGATDPAEPQATLAGKPSLSGLVLLADDEAGIRDFARRVLVQAGFEVLVASNGLEVVELAQIHRTQLRLILLDLTMPLRSGDEALADLRAMGYEGPVIRWSGYVQEDGPPPEGRTSFLRKPFGAEALMAAVRQSLA